MLTHTPKKNRGRWVRRQKLPQKRNFILKGNNSPGSHEQMNPRICGGRIPYNWSWDVGFNAESQGQ